MNERVEPRTNEVEGRGARAEASRGRDRALPARPGLLLLGVSRGVAAAIGG
jgi:hypothetical protein